MDPVWSVLGYKSPNGGHAKIELPSGNFRIRALDYKRSVPWGFVPRGRRSRILQIFRILKKSEILLFFRILKTQIRMLRRVEARGCEIF